MAKIDAQQISLFPIFGTRQQEPKLKGIARLAAQTIVMDEGHQVEFRPLPIRSILGHTKSKRGFGFARSINPYRGCEFGCRYCYARYTHEFMELRDPDLFERQIFMKENAAWMLRQELRSLHSQEAIAIGTATDPYQPIERKAKITRSLLEVLAAQKNLRIGVVTKSVLVLRDIDLFQKIAEQNRITINLTITTLDTRSARILEPRAPRPDLRIAALHRLRHAGVRAGVLCCPVMPGITDNFAALDSVAAAAREVGACFFHAEPLFLKPCSKPVFEGFIQANFPELLSSYQERYRDHAFVGAAYRKRVVQLVRAVKQKHGWLQGRFEAVRIEPVDQNGQMKIPYLEAKPAQSICRAGRQSASRTTVSTG